MINNFLAIDFDDIIVQSIGAFLGFLFALILALISSFINRRIEIAKIKRSLRIELYGILKDFDNNNGQLLSYSTPFWDSILSTGSLLSFSVLSTKKAIKDFLIPIGEVYAEIKLLDKLEESIYLETNARTITNEVKNKRAIIHNQIVNLAFMKAFIEKQTDEH